MREKLALYPLNLFERQNELHHTASKVFFDLYLPSKLIAALISKMMEVSTLRSSHLDQVNDIVFDFYGRRMVTCSSDRTMKVWDYNTKCNEWTFVEVKGHSDCVWRAAWASPEFGQIIASCSEDCTAKIWEEQESMESSAIYWVCRSTMKPCRKPVKDVKFVHKEAGLKVALACADGLIYFLEAKNIFDLVTWEPLVSCFCGLYHLIIHKISLLLADEISR